MLNYEFAKNLNLRFFVDDVSRAHKCNTFVNKLGCDNMVNDYKLTNVNTMDVIGFFFERSNYDESYIKELSDNIVQSGQVNEIIFRKVDNNKLQGVAGSRRFKAIEAAKLESFQAKVYDNMNDTEALNICLSENIHTRDMTSIDVAKLLKQWLNSGAKQADIAKSLGKSASWVSKLLKLLDSDQSTQNAMSAGDITAEHARVIELLPNEKDRKNMLAKASDDGLSVNEVKKLVDKKVNRIDVSDKIDKLEGSIIEYEQKIIDADNSSGQIEAFEKRLAELDIERKNLNGQLTDENIKQKAFSIAIVYEKIRPLETSITGIESEITVLSDERDKIDLPNVQKDYTTQAKKVKTAASKVEKLQKELDTAKDVHKAALTTLKPIQVLINDHQKLTKSITDKTQGKNQKQKALGDLVKANKDAYNNYDTLVTEVTAYNEESKQIEVLTKEYADISAQIPSLRGKSSNKQRFEDILKRNKIELGKMQILDTA